MNIQNINGEIRIQDINGEIKYNGDIGPRGPKGEKGNSIINARLQSHNLVIDIEETGAVDVGQIVPIKGEDYFTQAEIEEMENNISDGAIGLFNQNAMQKTNDFNSNATAKKSEYDTNATDKLEAYNTNDTQKTSAYNSNASSKTTAFNLNAESQTSAFNTNATEKLNDVNTAGSDQVSAITSAGTQQTSAVNSAGKTQVGNINTAGSTQVSAVENAGQIQVENVNSAGTTQVNSVNTAGNNKLNEINSNQTVQQVNDHETRITRLEKASHIYGIKRLRNNNSSSAWERTDDSIGLVANATKDGAVAKNDFDNLSPWKDIITFNLDLTTKKIKAYYGDADFKFDGTNGDVYTHIPDVYIKIWQDNDYDYIQIADHAKTGFTKVNAFDIQRYHTGLVDNTLRSYSGLYPARNKTLPAFRTSAQALGSEFCLMDWRYFILQLLYLVEYADYNSQSKLGNGITSMRYSKDDKALIAENSTNRIIINSTGGNAFLVGQTIAIGTDRESFTVASAERTITAIEDYSEDGITGKSITFDGDPVNIAIDNVIWSCGQISGGCDSLGMKSGCLVDDSKHAVIYRGIENIFGNIWQWVDSLNMKDGQVYACYNPANYQSDKFNDGYDAIGYMNSTTEGYAKELGYDPNNPLIKLTKTVGGGSTTYITDYYYVNATGNRVARVGGFLDNGLVAGLWYWVFNYGSSYAYWSIGARVLKYQ